MSIYDNPYLRQMAQMPQFQQFTAPQNNGIQWVQGEEAAKSYYNNDHTHTSLYGAQLNALGIAIGLRRANSKLAEYLY
jgi:hypothetical protein